MLVDKLRTPSLVAPNAQFGTTHWSLVLAARDEDSPNGAEALEQLCRRYWSPVYVFIRRRGHGPDDAQDLTQEFFARLIEKRYLDAADATKGRFRTFLLTVVSRFLVNQNERNRTAKRGGGAVHFSLDLELAEDGREVGPSASATPETVYERRWAETVVGTVLGRLRRELEEGGQGERFEALKPFLTAETATPSAAVIAAQLGLTEPAVYSAVHRLRRRFAELLRAEIAQTVRDPEEIEDELRYLIRALSG